jgi:hypothetical protein
VSREEDRHDLVANLRVAHALAGALFLGREQHGEEVAGVRLAAASLADDPQDDAVERGDGRAYAGVSRRRPEEKGERRRHPGVDRAHQDRHGRAHLARRVSDVRVEERLGDHVEGQAHHLGRCVDLRAVGPRALRALGVRRHGIGVPGDALVREGRRHQLALAPVKLALARQQAVADDGAQEPKRISFREALGLRHEHLVHEVRRRHDHDAPAHDRQLADPSTDRARLLHDPEAIPRDGEHVPENRSADLEPWGSRPPCSRGRREELAPPSHATGGLECETAEMLRVHEDLRLFSRR